MAAVPTGTTPRAWWRVDGVSPALAACTEIWLKQGRVSSVGNNQPRRDLLIDRPLAFMAASTATN